MVRKKQNSMCFFVLSWKMWVTLSYLLHYLVSLALSGWVFHQLTNDVMFKRCQSRHDDGGPWPGRGLGWSLVAGLHHLRTFLHSALAVHIVSSNVPVGRSRAAWWSGNQTNYNIKRLDSGLFSVVSTGLHRISILRPVMYSLHNWRLGSEYPNSKKIIFWRKKLIISILAKYKLNDLINFYYSFRAGYLVVHCLFNQSCSE